MSDSQNSDRLLALARSKEIFSASDAVAAGVHSAWLSRAVAEGLIERVARGRYRLAGRGATEHHTLALVASRAPTAVVCLLSALQFHRIGTQTPAEVWIAVARGAARPRMSYPPLRVARFSGKAFTEGIEVHGIEGQEVRVYALAKTIADCFKFRNRIGLDVALEALNDAWRQRRLSLADLNVYARIDRVQSVMQPYIEAVVQ